MSWRHVVEGIHRPAETGCHGRKRGDGVVTEAVPNALMELYVSEPPTMVVFRSMVMIRSLTSIRSPWLASDGLA